MPQADGSIIAVVDLDDKEAQKQLNKLKQSILSLDLDTKVKEATKARLESELKDVQEAYKAALKTDDTALQQSLEKQYDSLSNKIASITEKIKENGDAMGVLTEEAAQYEKRLVGVTEESQKMGNAGEESGEKMSEAMKQATSRLEKFEKRIVGLAKRVFVFSLITMALRNMRTWLSNAVKSNDEAAAAIARLKGALLTMAQPILQVVIPAFTMLVNVLTRVVTVVASLFARLSGKSLQQSADAAEALYDEQKAIKGVGGAAKKASKSLAAFDEINKLTTEDAGAGGAASTEIAPTFDLGEVDESFLDTILGYVEAIGAALAGWAIGKALGLDLTQTLGLMIAIYGAIQFVKTIMDMWTNGINFGNLLQSLEALLMVAAGLGLAFGKTAAGIALVIGGIALLVTGIHDAMENGMNWANTLTMIAGILAAGLGLTLITGSLLPLFIAGVTAALLALVMFTGNGEDLMDGLRDVFEGFTEFIGGVFAGDWEKAFSGLEKMGQGFQKVWETIVKSVQQAWDSFVQWFDEKTNGKFHYIIETIEKFVSGMAESLKETFHGIIEFIEGVFTQDWDKAWQGLKDIFRGVLDGMITIIESMINLAISGFNLLSEGIASLMGSLLSKVPDWVPVIGGRSWNPQGVRIQPITLPRIPALAQGAVIPPNREFMAVLGDQSAGRNLEAPEGLIREIVQSEMSPLVGLLQQLIEIERDGKVLQVDSTPFARVVHQYGTAESARIGGSLVSVRSDV